MVNYLNTSNSYLFTLFYPVHEKHVHKYTAQII